MVDSSEPEDSVNALTRQIVDKAYALFCAERGIHPSEQAAGHFALVVTAGAAHDFHGMTSAALVKMLMREFPGHEHEGGANPQGSRGP